VKEGKLRALGASSPARLPFAPDIPTIAEAGYPGFRWDSWGGMFAPSKTPRVIVNRLNRDVVSILNQPDIQKRMRSLGAEPAPTTPAEFDKHVAREVAIVLKLAKAAGLEPQ
jgi:tripartite-type tricarboxylate transporter receptor subunit TctC